MLATTPQLQPFFPFGAPRVPPALAYSRLSITLPTSHDGVGRVPQAWKFQEWIVPRHPIHAIRSRTCGCRATETVPAMARTRLALTERRAQ